MSETIVALQGGAGFVVQARLADFARARMREGLRVAGCVEEISGEPTAGCAGRVLRDLVTGRQHALGQDLGPGSLACHLNAAGVANACADILAAIAQGCDVVVLAKFGKLEAERTGLSDAFAAAVADNIPVVTAVAPRFSDAWIAYSGDMACYLEPRRSALEAWWRRLSGAGIASADQVALKRR